MVKLKWMNGEYIKAMDFDAFYELAEPYIKKVITSDCDCKKIAAMVKTESRFSRISRDTSISLRHVRNMISQMYVHKEDEDNLRDILKVLKDVLPILEAQEDYCNDALYARCPVMYPKRALRPAL